MAVLVDRVRTFFLPEHGGVRAAPAAVIAAAGLALGLLVAGSGPLQRLDWAAYDAFMRVATGAPSPAPNLVVVAIDELSFAEIGQPWPWPRALHAKLVEAIAKQQPASIAMDIVFQGAGAATEGDEALARSVKAAGNVLLAADLAPIEDRNYSVVQWSDPLPLLAHAAAGVGAVTIPFDPDGAIRRAVFEVEGRPILAVAALAHAGLPPPADPAHERLIWFNGAPRLGIETVSYYQALDPTLLPRGYFTGKHVFVGRALRAPASDEADTFRTPVAVQMAGVEIHATIADGLLRRQFVADPFGGRGAFLAWCALIAAAAAITAFALPPGAGAVALAVLGALITVGGYLALASAHVRVPVAAPIIAALAANGAGAAYRFTLTNRERRLIKRAFKHFVAPAIVDQMLSDPSKLKLGGEEHEVTVLFSDLDGFTTLSEHLTPPQLTAYLSGYFRDMIDLLLAERGTLDKLIGDSIMVYFGCPIGDPRHPVQACLGALAMQRRMREMNAEWARAGLPQLRTRIGINTGRVVAGNVGTDTIFNYTVLGDAVNLASRLEGVNKEYGTLIIVGEETWGRVSDRFDGRELDWIRVKGKARPVAIYELGAAAGELDPRRRELFARFAEGLAAYRAGRWTEGAAHFAGALELDPADGPSRTFAGRCQAYLSAGTPPEWDGVHVMRTK
ncbi:MAG: adenylate/guanylate cyclase domain-containing protein [Blastocatellia bacterium]|nr:MAG: adenylate/guanylate cyclase domain-containing protein [Blastocatellia bacterium]